MSKRTARARFRTLLREARKGDAAAARQLLAYIAAPGHRRLSIRIYFLARALGATDVDGFRPFGQAAAAALPYADLIAIAKDVAQMTEQPADPYLMANELLPSHYPFTLPFDGVTPQFAAPPLFSGEESCVLGRVTIGARAVLSSGCVIRADGHFVRIGDDFHIGEASTVHIAHELYPAIIGDRVTVGRNVVVHACTVGHDCIIEDDVVILDGAQINDGVLIEPGSTIFPRANLESGFVYAGSPATSVRKLEPAEHAKQKERLQERIGKHTISRQQLNSETAMKVREPAAPYSEDVFVADTAHMIGRIELAAGASVFFGCFLDATGGSIRIGENCNIQDNTRVKCDGGDVVIGHESTVGHNVVMASCLVGHRSLVGIGSILAPGTIVEDEVLLAGGSTTLEGQRLSSGWLWGGRPAQALARLDDRKRLMMKATIRHYHGYGASYRLSQLRSAQPGD